MSFILLGILNSQAAGAAISYWLSTLGGASTETGSSVAIDSEKNSYSFGNTNSVGAGFADFYLAKRDTAGIVQWQRVLGGDNSEQGFSVDVDSADNVYVLGDTGSEGAGNTDFLLAKYNSSGTIQWQRTLGGANLDKGASVAIDSADNVYAFGRTTSQGAGNNDFLLAKYNSSGTIQWQRVLGGSNNDFGESVAIDSDDNVYVLGWGFSVGAGSADALLAKYNSSGTIQWQRTLGGTGVDYGDSIHLDSSNNVYLFGRTNSEGEGNTDFLLAKYNTSGTIQWQRILGGSAAETGVSVSSDSTGNVYVLGQTETSGSSFSEFLFAKYDSSGTIQWQRSLGNPSTDQGQEITIDSDGSMYIMGTMNALGSSDNGIFLGKLPSDGSLTGTYVLDGVNVVYAASSLTGATSTLTSAASSATAATSTLTSATSTLTDASASLTNHFVEIPA